ACRPTLASAAPQPRDDACGLVEALLAARAAGALRRESEDVVLRHLASCTGCRRLAGALESPELDADVDVTGTSPHDLADLKLVPRENYERGREIGRGGMGRVLLARALGLGRAVAIKELLDERLQARFEREARLTARLQHPAIVSVHEAGRWPSGEPFYAMKYVAGRPLHVVIAEKGTLA